MNRKNCVLPPINQFELEKEKNVLTHCRVVAKRLQCYDCFLCCTIAHFARWRLKFVSEKIWAVIRCGYEDVFLDCSCLINFRSFTDTLISSRKMTQENFPTGKFHFSPLITKAVFHVKNATVIKFSWTLMFLNLAQLFSHLKSLLCRILWSHFLSHWTCATQFFI